jgi:hypothetical protein
LFGSFISRNNDIGGYWGIGKLCSLARESATDVVKLDLIEKSISPISHEFDRLVGGYHSLLVKNLIVLGIPLNWVSSANIDINFSPPIPSDRFIPITSWGDLFQVTASIIDDRNFLYSVSGFGYCGPHNPNKEFRRISGQECF